MIKRQYLHSPAPVNMTLHLTRLVPGNAQHQGDREQQQDSFGFSDLRNPDGVLVVVADGIGDHTLGKEASWLAINTLLFIAIN